MDYPYDEGEKVYPPEARPLVGYVTIQSDLRIKGKTVIITSLKDESEIYYLPILSFDVLNQSIGQLGLPPGNYIAKIAGDDEEHLFSITPTDIPTYIQWGGYYG